MNPQLAAVQVGSAHETPAIRARRLQDEARAAAGSAAAGVLTMADALCDHIEELAALKDALPDGEREAFRRLATEIRGRVDSITAIRSRRR